MTQRYSEKSRRNRTLILTFSLREKGLLLHASRLYE